MKKDNQKGEETREGEKEWKQQKLKSKRRKGGRKKELNNGKEGKRKAEEKERGNLGGNLNAAQCGARVGMHTGKLTEDVKCIYHRTHSSCIPVTLL